MCRGRAGLLRQNARILARFLAWRYGHAVTALFKRPKLTTQQVGATGEHFVAPSSTGAVATPGHSPGTCMTSTCWPATRHTTA